MSAFSDQAAKFNASQNGIRQLNEAQSQFSGQMVNRVHRIHQVLAGQYAPTGEISPGGKTEGASARPSLLKVMEEKTRNLMEIDEVLEHIEALLGVADNSGLKINGVERGGHSQAAYPQ